MFLPGSTIQGIVNFFIGKKGILLWEKPRCREPPGLGVVDREWSCGRRRVTYQAEPDRDRVNLLFDSFFSRTLQRNSAMTEHHILHSSDKRRIRDISAAKKKASTFIVPRIDSKDIAPKTLRLDQIGAASFSSTLFWSRHKQDVSATMHGNSASFRKCEVFCLRRHFSADASRPPPFDT